MRTRQSALARLRTALNVALMRRRLGANPADLVEPPRSTRTVRRAPPSIAEARGLLAALEDDPLMRCFVLLWLAVGLRRGEALGLRWEDVNFEGRYLVVQRRVNRVRGLGLLVREGTKTSASNRPVVLPSLVVEALMRRQEHQHEEQLQAGSRWKGTANGYIFTSKVGTLIEPRNVNRAFSAALTRADLAQRSPHALRHDFAGLLLTGGVPNRVTQELMRHTTYGLTANVYQQPPDELQRAGAAVVDRLLGETT